MKYDPAWAKGEKICSIQVFSDRQMGRLITKGHLQRGSLIIHQLKRVLFLVNLMCTYQFYMYNTVQETNILLLRPSWSNMIHRHSLLEQCMFIVCKGYHDKMISHTGKYPVMLCKQPNTCTVYLYSSIHNIGIIFISHTCITWKTSYYHMQLTYLLITCTNLN